MCRPATPCSLVRYFKNRIINTRYLHQVTHKLFIITDSIYLVNSLIFLINTCYNYLQIAGLTNIVYYAAAVKENLCMARILLVVVFIQNCFYSCNSKNVPVLIEYKF